MQDICWNPAQWHKALSGKGEANPVLLRAASFCNAASVYSVVYNITLIPRDVNKLKAVSHAQSGFSTNKVHMEGPCNRIMRVADRRSAAGDLHDCRAENAHRHVNAV
ncbi:MAG: hypothetical protein ACI4MG_00770 [Aristaeellaceae bacterium]